jgi:hypothetical protein
MIQPRTQALRSDARTSFQRGTSVRTKSLGARLNDHTKIYKTRAGDWN